MIYREAMAHVERIEHRCEFQLMPADITWVTDQPECTSRLVKYIEWVADKQRREWEDGFYSATGEACCKSPYITSTSNTVLPGERGMITEDDLLLPVKRLRQKVNETEVEDVQQLKLFTQKLMNDMLDYMSVIARSAVHINNSVRMLAPPML
jgi:hypothetical protein